MFNKNDKQMAERISKTLHNLQVQYGINFNDETQWLDGLAERFGEEIHRGADEDSDVMFYWDV